ncbi:hypothetical protein D3C75_591240 [compost metagenome]
MPVDAERRCSVVDGSVRPLSVDGGAGADRNHLACFPLRSARRGLCRPDRQAADPDRHSCLDAGCDCFALPVVDQQSAYAMGSFTLGVQPWNRQRGEYSRLAGDDIGCGASRCSWRCDQSQCHRLQCSPRRWARPCRHHHCQLEPAMGVCTEYRVAGERARDIHIRVSAWPHDACAKGATSHCHAYRPAVCSPCLSAARSHSANLVFHQLRKQPMGIAAVGRGWRRGWRLRSAGWQPGRWRRFGRYPA